MQQALEALRTLHDENMDYLTRNNLGGENNQCMVFARETITALRERLAQPEMEPCAGRNCGSTNPNLHSAECFEDYEKATGTNQWQGLTDEKKVKRVYFPTSWITPVPIHSQEKSK